MSTDSIPTPDAPLRVICACGHTALYDSVDDFEDDGGQLSYHTQTDLYAAVCPSCGASRPVKAGLFDWDDIGAEFCLTFGAFTEDYDPLADGLDTPFDLNKTDFSAVANPVYVARQRFDPICLRCGARLTDANIRADGNAPEVGWEYYECPECGKHIHPDSAGSLGDSPQ